MILQNCDYIKQVKPTNKKNRQANRNKKAEPLTKVRFNLFVDRIHMLGKVGPAHKRTTTASHRTCKRSFEVEH